MPSNASVVLWPGYGNGVICLSKYLSIFSTYSGCSLYHVRISTDQDLQCGEAGGGGGLGGRLDYLSFDPYYAEIYI